MAMLMSVMSFAVETVAYTLTTTATGGNTSPHNAYASAAEATYDGITWNVTGNSSMEPWRIGGKSITAVDRAVYSKTAMAADITKIEITHATINLTCNSCVLTISDAANGEGETFPVTVTQNTTTTITLPEGDYSNKYYKLVYNVTNSGTSNKYVQLSEIKFYTEVQTSVEAPTFTPEEGKVAANNTFAEPFALTIASATEGATIKYTLDGTDPALETALTYEAPITISTMVQVRAIAVKGEESSVEATATYIVASTEEKPYTASEAITAQALGLAANVYVTGTVKSIEEISTEYGNATYNITDGVKELKIYRGKNLENAKFTSADQLLVGDVVVVKGDLTSYNGAAQLGQNNYLISRSTPVVSYDVTVSANPAEAGTVAGGGSFEENEEITVEAVANEGYEFVNWTVAGEEVSTDAEYTFSVTADLALVANFKEVVAEPKYDMEIVCSNLKTMSEGNMTYFMGSSSDGMSIDLVVFGFEGKGTYEVEGSIDAGGEYFTLAGEAEYLYSEELEADALVAVVTANGAMSLKITMYKKTLVPTETIVVENMTKTIQSYGWMKQLTLDGEHETYGQVTLIASGCDGTYGTYAVTAWLGEDIELEGEGEWKNEGELDVLEVIAETADGKVLKIVGQTEYVAPVEPVSMYAEVEFTVDEEGILRVTGTTNDEVAVQLYVYGWNEVGYGTYGEGEVIGFIGDTEVANQQYTATIEQEGNVAYLHVILNDAEGNLYDLTAGGMALENPAAGAGSRTTVIVEEAEITTSAMFPTDLEIYGWSNDDREVVIALWDGTTKQYGEYTTDFVVEVDGEQYDLLENTVATYSLEDGLAVLRAAVAAGKDTLDLIVSGAPWVDPATAEPTDTVTLAFTKGTINVSFDGTATIKGGNSDLGVQIFTMGGDIYEGITSEQFNSYSSYLMIDWMKVDIYRGELKVVDLTNDVKVAYIGVLGADYKWYNITLTTADEIPTALDNINATVAPAKRINNGQLIIINNGVEYNAQGAIVK